MLGIQPHKITVELKDFFRLTCRKFNLMEFMLQKYVKLTEHDHDGIIFNHEEKEYLIGTTNPGYIKWKPEELNTVDFMVVPNINLEEKYGRRVLDLYVGFNDTTLCRYNKQFYAFTVINEAGFNELARGL
jgi:ATP-dependent DNA ligase